MPWRTAHQITAILVREALEAGKGPSDIDRSFVDKAARAYIGHDLGLYDATIREVLDPLRAVQARTLIGGPAPSEVKRQIGGCFAALERDHETVRTLRKRLDEGAGKLEQAIDAVLG